MTRNCSRGCPDRADSPLQTLLMPSIKLAHRTVCCALDLSWFSRSRLRHRRQVIRFLPLRPSARAHVSVDGFDHGVAEFGEVVQHGIGAVQSFAGGRVLGLWDGNDVKTGRGRG